MLVKYLGSWLARPQNLGCKPGTDLGGAGEEVSRWQARGIRYCATEMLESHITDSSCFFREFGQVLCPWM